MSFNKKTSITDVDAIISLIVIVAMPVFPANTVVKETQNFLSHNVLSNVKRQNFGTFFTTLDNDLYVAFVGFEPKNDFFISYFS